MGIPDDEQAPPTTMTKTDSRPQHIPQHHTPTSASTSSVSIDKAYEQTANKDEDIVDNEKEPKNDIEGHPEAEDHTNYPHGLKLYLLIAALCLAIFLVALDQTIIATAIPKITDRFNSISDIGWYGSAYFLTSTALQPSFGRIYKVFQIKWVFLGAIFVFELGSLICAVAPSSTALIVGRAIAGIGVGGIFSGALVIIAHSLPLIRRPLVFGLTGAMWGLASVAGPLLGGRNSSFHKSDCFFLLIAPKKVSLPIISHGDGASTSTCQLAHSPSSLS